MTPLVPSCHLCAIQSLTLIVQAIVRQQWQTVVLLADATCPTQDVSIIGRTRAQWTVVLM